LLSCFVGWLAGWSVSLSFIWSIQGRVEGSVDLSVGQSDSQLDSTVLWPSPGLINPDEAVMWEPKCYKNLNKEEDM